MGSDDFGCVNVSMTLVDVGAVGGLVLGGSFLGGVVSILGLVLLGFVWACTEDLAIGVRLCAGSVSECLGSGETAVCDETVTIHIACG